MCEWTENIEKCLATNAQHRTKMTANAHKIINLEDGSGDIGVGVGFVSGRCTEFRTEVFGFTVLMEHGIGNCQLVFALYS